MSKWVYDPKTNTMVEKKFNNDIDYKMLHSGFQVIDHKHNLVFTIGPDDSISFNDRGIHQYLFTDYRTAAQVAQRIRRVYPKSRFATPEGLLTWRRGKTPELDHPVKENMSADDKAMLRCLLEEVNPQDIDKYVESLNESGYWFGLGGMSSVGQTPGTTQHGLKGAINALPSMILSFLVCPPATILRWIGAVRARSEKRWLKTRINPNRWLDFVATPYEREKAKNELNANSQYYYTTLANGEVLRVVGSSTLEAKEMIMAIEHKDIIPRYAEWNNKLDLHIADNNSSNDDNTVINTSNTNDFIMWVIKFKNGEACYAFGKPDASDKEDIMEKAVDSRKAIVEYYKKIKYHDEDNGEKKTQRHPGLKFNGENEELMELFKVPEIDDMIRIENPTSYRLITENNFKNFSEPTTSPMHWEAVGFVNYVINTKFGEFTIPLTTDKEYKVLIDLLNKPTGGFNEINTNIINDKATRGTFSWYKVELPNGDWVIVPDEVSSGNGANVRNSLEISINKYEDAIEKAIVEGNEQKKISDETKKQYMKMKQMRSQDRSTRQFDSDTFVFDHPEGSIDEIKAWYSNWAENTVAAKVDKHHNKVIERNIRYAATA